MVSWGKAFWKGFVIVLWSIVWAIVGLIVFLLSLGAGLAVVISNPYTFLSNPLAFGTAIVGMFIGFFIAALGAYASALKVAVDTALEEMQRLRDRT